MLVGWSQERCSRCILQLKPTGLVEMQFIVFPRITFGGSTILVPVADTAIVFLRWSGTSCMSPTSWCWMGFLKGDRESVACNSPNDVINGKHAESDKEKKDLEEVMCSLHLLSLPLSLVVIIPCTIARILNIGRSTMRLHITLLITPSGLLCMQNLQSVRVQRQRFDFLGPLTMTSDQTQINNRYHVAHNSNLFDQRLQEHGKQLTDCRCVT